MRSYRVFSESPSWRTLGRVAQLAEHSTLNRQVVGSIPTASTISNLVLSSRYRSRIVLLVWFIFQNLTKNLTKLSSLVPLIDDLA
jgi:hypothetical protein